MRPEFRRRLLRMLDITCKITRKFTQERPSWRLPLWKLQDLTTKCPQLSCLIARRRSKLTNSTALIILTLREPKTLEYSSKNGHKIWGKAVTLIALLITKQRRIISQNVTEVNFWRNHCNHLNCRISKSLWRVMPVRPKLPIKWPRLIWHGKQRCLWSFFLLRTCGILLWILHRLHREIIVVRLPLQVETAM